MTEQTEYGDRPEVQVEGTEVVHGADGPPADAAREFPLYGKVTAGQQIGTVGSAVAATHFEAGQFVDAGDQASRDAGIEGAKISDFDGGITVERTNSDEYNRPDLDWSKDGSVEIEIRVGKDLLTLTHAYEVGTRSPLQVLRDLANLAEPYLEDERI